MKLRATMTTMPYKTNTIATKNNLGIGVLAISDVKLERVYEELLVLISSLTKGTCTSNSINVALCLAINAYQGVIEKNLSSNLSRVVVTYSSCPLQIITRLVDLRPLLR